MLSKYCNKDDRHFVVIIVSATLLCVFPAQSRLLLPHSPLFSHAIVHRHRLGLFISCDHNQASNELCGLFVFHFIFIFYFFVGSDH